MPKVNKEKLIAVIGPTGSGKTRIGEQLAEIFSGEIISADSRQVFKGMDIGTAKEKELLVPQHLIDIKNPGESFTVAEYQQEAYRIIDDMLARGKVPFLVGGSMLYAESVMNGYVFAAGKKSRHQQPRYDVLKLGIAWEREKLKARKVSVLDTMLANGLIEEIKTLVQQGVNAEWLKRSALEYRHFTPHVQGELTFEEALEKTRVAINQYVKRQYTWWRRHPDVLWVANFAEAKKSVKTFLSSNPMV